MLSLSTETLTEYNAQLGQLNVFCIIAFVNMGTLTWVYTILYYFGLELMAFVLVDVVVKAPLRDAASEQEKRTIWLYESAGLFLLCLLLYCLHHMPYLLILLTCITFTYTQLFGRTNLSQLVANLRAQWENHLQHEENMKQIERQKRQQQQLQQQALGMAGLNHSATAELTNFNGSGQHQGYGLGFPYLGKQGNLHYPPNATVVPGQDRPTYSVSPTSASYQEAIKQGQATYNATARNWNNISGSPLSVADNQQINAFTGPSKSNSVHSHGSMHSSLDGSDRRALLPNVNQLQRRSLRPDPGGKLLPKPLPSSTSFKSKFMNVIGFRPSTPKPVGLMNSGQNMCFINSTIQCLARGPFLVECLTADAAKELECSVAESELLSSLAELLDIVTVDPANSDYKVFNAKRFRQAVSVLNPGLVTPPSEHMHQQDAAEFLMWLLETVHSILNKNSQVLQCDAASLSSDDRFSSPRLANLKLIYGDLNANRIKDLKDQCRREIAVANGLENESYAEAIQRLSDLDWLTHKQANDTIVDGLFTGQLVEAYHSLEHGQISVNLQAFNVLPVPVAPPRPSSGLVVLEDCFTSFCNIENLLDVPVGEPEGLAGNPTQRDHPLLQISNVNRPQNTKFRAGFNSTPKTRKSVRSVHNGDSTPSRVSPIHQHVFPSPITYTSTPIITQTMCASPTLPRFKHQDNAATDNDYHKQFRTSTPIYPEKLLPRTQPKLQRRCLLRQLPECLVIQLMRFRYDSIANVSTKINTSVSIRLKGFNLREVIFDTVTHRSDMTASNGGYVYELYGICLHLGANSTSHGHYVSYCLDGVKWYRMDDQDVQEVNMEYQLTTEEVRQNAYLLFYRRMGTDSL